MTIKVEDTPNEIVIKIDKAILNDIKEIDPEKEVTNLKELVIGRESVVKRSMLRVYIDRDLVDEIKQVLARLLVYYIGESNG